MCVCVCVCVYVYVYCLIAITIMATGALEHTHPCTHPVFSSIFMQYFGALFLDGGRPIKTLPSLRKMPYSVTKNELVTSWLLN